MGGATRLTAYAGTRVGGEAVTDRLGGMGPMRSAALLKLGGFPARTRILCASSGYPYAPAGFSRKREAPRRRLDNTRSIVCSCQTAV